MSSIRGSRKSVGGMVLMMSFVLTSSESLPAQSAHATPGLSRIQRSQTSDNNKQKPASTPSQDSASGRPNPADARKAKILEDTNRLYRMAEELKAEVAKSNKDILSVAVVKKADEIEKLARSLKERMRNE